MFKKIIKIGFPKVYEFLNGLLSLFAVVFPVEVISVEEFDMMLHCFLLVSCHMCYDVLNILTLCKTAMTTYKVTLTQKERDELMSITKGGMHSSKKVIHALILLNCDEGEFSEKVSNEDVAKVLKIGTRNYRQIKKEICRRRL